MTPKQERFSQNVINGMTYSDAYRDAYDATNMKDTAIWQEASSVAEHPQVSLRIQEGNKAIQAAGLWSRERSVEELETVLRLAKSPEGKHAAQLGPANQAIKQITELSGLTQEQPKTDVRITQVTIVMPESKKVVEAEEWTTE